MMVAFPFSSACCTSVLRCPIRASVFYAIACMTWELSYGAKNVLAWMFTVKLSKFDRSGNWAASAPKSTCGRAGRAGGMRDPSTRATSEGSISASHPPSCCYWDDITNLLLILMFTLIQKITNTYLILFHLFFTHKKLYTPCYIKCAHTNT